MQIQDRALRPISPTPDTACLVCGGHAPCIGAVDFDKGDDERTQSQPCPYSPVRYHRCSFCGFTFAPEFLSWSEQDFRDKVYNDDYERHDPDYRIERPRANANYMVKLFGGLGRPARHLDYGGGNGALSHLLTQQGWTSRCYDPFAQSAPDLSSLGRFDLITAFEVFEHVPDPNQLVENLKHLMDKACLVLISTLVTDAVPPGQSVLEWWYCAPRVGHVSLFSRHSLITLALRHGLSFCSIDDSMHCFSNRMPDWRGP